MDAQTQRRDPAAPFGLSLYRYNYEGAGIIFTVSRNFAALQIAHMFRSVGQQRHEPRLLQGGTQAALVFRACSRLAAGFNLPTIRDVALHETAGILVVDFTHMIVAKLAYFAARVALRAKPRRTRARGAR